MILKLLLQLGDFELAIVLEVGRLGPHTIDLCLPLLVNLFELLAIVLVPNVEVLIGVANRLLDG